MSFWEEEALNQLDSIRASEYYQGEYEDYFQGDILNPSPTIKNNGESTSTMINGLPKGFKDNVPF